MSEVKKGRGYTRVSTVMQCQDGVSLDQQKKDIERYCEYNQITLVKLYEDAGYSGSDFDRPAFNSLLSEIQPDELFIVWDLSRYSRITWHAIKTAEDLYKKGVYLVSLKEKIDLSTAMGKCCFTIICCFMDLERRKVAERTSAALQHLSREGKLRSRAVFGWKYVGADKDMELVPEQQLVIKKIVDMYKKEMSLSGIASTLNKEGLNSCLTLNKKPGAREQIFYPETIKRILMDAGAIKDEKVKRPGLQQRITSHHKESRNKPLSCQDKSNESKDNLTEIQDVPIESQNKPTVD